MDGIGIQKYKEALELKHYGVVGMRWGRRKGGVGDILRRRVSAINTAEKRYEKKLKKTEGKYGKAKSTRDKMKAIYKKMPKGKDFDRQVDKLVSDTLKSEKAGVKVKTRDFDTQLTAILSNARQSQKIGKAVKKSTRQTERYKKRMTKMRSKITKMKNMRTSAISSAERDYGKRYVADALTKR